MGMFDRMGRVISSNFNALLDRVEDPKKSIDQTLEDMRDQIRAARQEVVRAVAAGKQLEKKVAELDGEVERWSKRAELAVEHGDDDLAREALLQKRRVVGERITLLRVDDQRLRFAAHFAHVVEHERAVAVVEARPAPA